MNPVQVMRGDGPIVLGVPHAGTFLPDAVADRLDENGRSLADTDWHVDRLYEGLLADATMVRATFHRYVIDANRDPSGASLYPGQNTTALCPVTDFDGKPIYRTGQEPDADEIAARRDAFHQPYHEALEAELARIQERWGLAVLYDCHSIRSHVPHLFEGTLPDFNIGTDGGRTCDAAVEAIVRRSCARAAGYSYVVNGRFRGGWTTRAYGRPAEGRHAIQMELAQATHLSAEAPPFAFDEPKAERLRKVLTPILAELDAWARAASTRPAARQESLS